MKKTVHLILMLFFLSALSPSAEAQTYSESDYGNMLTAIEKSHDLTFPDWGPYTKKYIGISHIPDLKKGLRFDLSVFPGFYRRKLDIPNVFFESGYHPWEASPDMYYFAFRHEVEWQDRVYTDISYSYINDQSRLIRIQCQNTTNLEQSIVLHFMASLHFPSLKEYDPDTPLLPARAVLPEKAQWFDALDYTDFLYAKPGPQDKLVYDGKMRGEVRANNFVNGSGIGKGFGIDKGDKVLYNWDIKNSINDAALVMRYRMKENESLQLQGAGLIDIIVPLRGTGELETVSIPIGTVNAGQADLTLTSLGGAGIEIDGFTIVPENNVSDIAFEKTDWNPVPELIEGPVDNSILIKYEDTKNFYGIKWFYPQFKIRQYFGKDLDIYFRRMANNHTKTVFHDQGKGHYTNIFLRPITLDAQSGKTIYGLVCTGDEETVKSILSEYTDDKNFEPIYNQARQHLTDMTPSQQGKPFTFSQKRMAATVLSNVVYPVYTQKQYIRHHAPGRWWDCLYTWDSGFIGLGLLELDEKRAVENLNAYVQEPGAQSAFIHHGTPVPVQHYLFYELWNRTQSKELLNYFYPRMKQYYEFLSGNTPGSTTRTLKSNLLKTWDYFYNSGGWDDYPPQKYTHNYKMEATNTPVVNTAHAIRTAKILKMAAKQLGLKNDMKSYNKDIKMFSKALQQNAWDDDAGYFGYVVHNEQGEPIKILQNEKGENMNKGLGGCYPLFAGICTDEQKQKILDHLKTEGEIWSRVGLSAVDQTASYYTNDGYWNGAVWMPHQWFFWKTMLDLGESQFAFKIADTALKVWKQEVEATYCCMEHFIIESGRGAGWHEFGGLSSPVLIWYSAYYKPGMVTTGLNAWIEEKKFNQDNTDFTATIQFSKEQNADKSTVLVCMNPDFDYNVLINGKPIAYEKLTDTCLCLKVPIKSNPLKFKLTKK